MSISLFLLSLGLLVVIFGLPISFWHDIRHIEKISLKGPLSLYIFYLFLFLFLYMSLIALEFLHFFKDVVYDIILFLFVIIPILFALFGKRIIIRSKTVKIEEGNKSFEIPSTIYQRLSMKEIEMLKYRYSLTYKLLLIISGVARAVWYYNLFIFISILVFDYETKFKILPINLFISIYLLAVLANEVVISTLWWIELKRDYLMSLKFGQKASKRLILKLHNKMYFEKKGDKITLMEVLWEFRRALFMPTGLIVFINYLSIRDLPPFELRGKVIRKRNKEMAIVNLDIKSSKG